MAESGLGQEDQRFAVVICLPDDASLRGTWIAVFEVIVGELFNGLAITGKINLCMPAVRIAHPGNQAVSDVR